MYFSKKSEIFYLTFHRPKIHCGIRILNNFIHPWIHGYIQIPIYPFIQLSMNTWILIDKLSFFWLITKIMATFWLILLIFAISKSIRIPMDTLSIHQIFMISIVSMIYNYPCYISIHDIQVSMVSKYRVSGYQKSVAFIHSSLFSIKGF